MNSAILHWLWPVCLLAPIPVAAQDYANEGGEAVREERAARAEEDQIVVTSRVEDATRAEANLQARRIAPSVNGDDPLARFEVPLCPGVIGLTTEAAGLVIDRVRENARALGLRVWDDGCEANVVLAFVDDGQAMLARMMDENPGRFQYFSRAERRRMLEPGPVRVWTDVVPANLLGAPIGRQRNLVERPRTSAWVSHSLISGSIRNDIVSVWVIVDREAVRGLSLRQLADYATMRALVQTSPADELGISSVLGLFNEDGPWPEELTDFDLAYLRAVYSGIPNLPAANKLGRVAAELAAIEAAHEAQDSADP